MNPAPTVLDATILLVDDERDVRSICRQALELEGATVIEAPDGEVALQLVEAWSPPFDLVITDMTMPRINGWELAEVLSVFHPELPVLGMTGDSGKADRRIPTLLKPFSIEEFTDAAILMRSRAIGMRGWAQERRARAREARRIAREMQARNKVAGVRWELVAIGMELQRLNMRPN